MFSNKTTQSTLPRFIIAGFMAAALLLVGCSPQSPETESEEIPLGQLPDTVRPESYRVDLTIIPDQAQFAGHTEISVMLTEASDHIWLHGNQLQVSRAQAQLAGGETATASYQQVAEIGVARLDFDRTLPPGPAKLVIDYAAPFNESLEGLYRVIDNGEAYAFTQFEATSARLAFPGFDEPRFKVPFDISLEIDMNHRAVTNTPAIRETVLDNGRRRIEYATTKPLPTYLIAFAVGTLDEVVWQPVPATELRTNPLPLRGYATKGKGARLTYALQHTAEILTALESYFGIAYPYAKLDIIAVPDFQAGAMENAGAITYREQLILLDERAPVPQKRRYAMVHAHELAHQWFGNLVTPQWWDDIWLNEAFATWMAYRTMDTLVPDNSYRQEKLSAALEAMRNDRLVSARQIRQPIDTHSDIASAFDGITYSKGGAVLTMFERFIGAEAFKTGIQNYMRTFAFANTDARDFIHAIAQQRSDLAEGIVEKAFFSFLEQPGTPLVNFDWHCQQGSAEVSVSQSRYLPLGTSGDDNRQWLLPLCLAYDDAGERQSYCTLITDRTSTFSLPGAGCPSYIMPNADASSYYRYTLSADNWNQLLNSRQLSEAELLSAANSLSAAYHQGSLSTAGYLQALPYLVASDNREVIAAPMSDLRLVLNEMLGAPQQQQLREILRKLYRGKLSSIGLETQLSSDAAERLRRTLVQFLVRDVRDRELIRNLSEKAKRYTGTRDEDKLNPAALNSNLRNAALHAAVQLAAPAYSNHLKNLMLSSQDALLRQEIMRSLSRSPDPSVRRDMRALILSQQLRDNEIRNVIYPQMADPVSRDEMWQWLLEHFDGVLERLPASAKGNIIAPAANFCTPDRQVEINETLAERIRTMERGPRALANTLESIGLCVALVNRHRAETEQYFSKML